MLQKRWIILGIFLITLGMLGSGFYVYRAMSPSLKPVNLSIAEEIDAHQPCEQVTLTLQNIAPSKQIRVLVNGEQKDTMKTKVRQIVVPDRALIEIDGTAISQPFCVTVFSQKDTKGHTIMVQQNVAVAAHIQVQ